MTMDKMFEQTDQIAEYNVQWKIVDDLLSGTVAMRAAKRIYLPQFTAETDDNYDIRLRNSYLYNGYAKNLNRGVGKVFSKPITLQEGTNDSILEFFDDVDTTGRTGTQFAKEVFKNAVNHGISYILTDFPLIESGLNLAQERDIGAAPFWISIKATQVLEIRSQRVQGRQTLTYFRFLETIEDNTDDNTVTNQTTDRQQVKVYLMDALTEVITWEIYRKNNNGNVFLQATGTFDGTTRIPISPMYTNRTDFFMGLPAMGDLAQLNLRHWQSNSDQINILTVTRLPILVTKGLQPQSDANGNPVDTVVISPTGRIDVPENGDVKYVEHSGEAISAGERDLADLEKKMDSFGLEIQVSQASGTETATGRLIDAAEGNSMLKDMTLSLRDTLVMALMFTAEWMNIDFNDLFNVLVNEDLGMPRKDPQEIKMLLTLFEGGVITAQELRTELRSREVLGEGFTAELINNDTNNTTGE